MSSIFRENLKIVIASLFVLLLVAGCSSTKITSGQILVANRLPRPGTIWVYDFVAKPVDMQVGSSSTGETSEPSKPLTPKEIQIAKQLGKSITAQLIQQINAMGLHAELATSSSKPQVNDIVLRGYLYSVEAGNAAKRIFIGFGYGASMLKTIIEGYQMRANGLHKLSSADLAASGGELPGGGAMSVTSFLIYSNPITLIIGPAVKGIQEIRGGPTLEGRVTNTASKIADVLKVRFQEEGWITQ
ncbi:MAG TPA: DUF4410 domain-containing protein [Victivallales bacterium]|nr:DUF4410 domain-containing protein [Victivallales bacterium]